MVAKNTDIEKRLWKAADELRANSKLKSSDYSVPVLGLIFLRYAELKFAKAQKELEGQAIGRRRVGPVDYQAQGVLYIPKEARYENLLNIPEGKNIGLAVNNAMKAIEKHNPDLKDVLPKTYNRLDNRVLITLLKNFNVQIEIEGDAFGKIYEYFLGNFAMSEGRKGGEFFTPTSIVRLIVQILEPFKGRIYDPASGSGGMFVQSARFVAQHQADPSEAISIFGQERVAETVRLDKMNLAVHGLSGDIRQGNTYYEDIHNSVGKFDFVMANPPFNVNNIDKERIKDDPRFPFGMPNVDNGNYIWMQIFYSALNQNGRAGFVMVNSAADARHSEMAIRKQMIEDGVVDVVVSIASNFFYTVTLPCTLWFLDKGKKGTEREDQVLFVDARNIFTQLDRAHREFNPNQLLFIASLARLYRGEDLNGYQLDTSDLNLVGEQLELVQAAFAEGTYTDIPGLCSLSSHDQIEEQDWSLNPGRYVGIVGKKDSDFDFISGFQSLNRELEQLNHQSRELEDQIARNSNKLLENID
ncbi:MAG TPA: SAM-dependent DNA methyltransferase [Anaerolineae bacterium]|nr:SAM-dependent DNA methyltransferase [Anaerolineae bacterium]